MASFAYEGGVPAYYQDLDYINVTGAGGAVGVGSRPLPKMNPYQTELPNFVPTPLDPSILAMGRDAQAALQAQLAELNRMRALIGPELQSSLARIGTDETHNIGATQEGMAERGLFESGVRREAETRVHGDAARSRQDVQSDATAQYADIASQQAQAQFAYQQAMQAQQLAASQFYAQHPPLGGFGSGSWGGYSNGLIPQSAMTYVPGVWYVAPQAYGSLQQLLAAARSAGVLSPGEAIATGAYRPLSVQESLYQQYLNGSHPAPVAQPGTSNHGWGLAIDFSMANNDFINWLANAASQYGWYGTVQGEPWHYSYGVTG